MSKKHVPNRILTDAFREIKYTLSRFLSLFLLSALAVAFLSGLRTTAPDMEHTADDYYDRTHLMDVRVLSTLGLTEEDIDVLSAQEGVSAAEGAWYVDATLHAAENDYIVRFHSLSEAGINEPEVVDGRLPEADDECVVEPELLTTLGLSLGDTITLDMEGTSYEDSLHTNTYTVVGTVNSSLYMSTDRGTSTVGTGRLTAVAFLPREAFDLDYYTEAYLLMEGGEALLCYDDEYQDRVDELIDALEPLGEERAANRYDEVIREATDELNDAQQEYDQAAADAQQQLADGEQELADARAELDDGWQQYYDGRDTLSRETADALQQIEDAQAELSDALAELEQGEVDYQDGLDQYEQGLADYQEGQDQYNQGYQELLDGEAEYAENYRKLQEAQEAYDQGLQEYEDGMAQLADGAAQLEDARRQLESAQAELSAGAAQISAGQAQLDAGRTALNQAQSDMNGQLDTLGGVMGATGSELNSADAILSPDTNWTEQDGKTVSGLLTFAGDSLTDQFNNMVSQGLMTEEESQQISDSLNNAIAQGSEGDPSGLKTFFSGTIPGLFASGQAQLDSAQQQLDAGAAQLSAGQVQYNQGRQAFEENEAALYESAQTLNEAKAELDSAAEELADGWAQLAQGRQELDDGWAELQTAREELEAGRQELEDSQQQLADARTELDDGWQQYYDGLNELADAKTTLTQETADAQKELADAYQELVDGEAEYADGVQEYEDGKAEADSELSDARQQLNDARRDIADIENCEWYILGRNTNTGYVSYQQDAERMGNLANVFPIIFFLVAALVCLTTMTRMVEEQRVQIGGLKALGYGRAAIALKYVGYGFLSSFGGGLVGLVVGCTLIPTIIFNAWKVMYTVGDLQITFFPSISILSVGAAVFCVTGTALASSFAALTAVPASLMRPRAPQAGKRVLLERVKFLWKRLTFAQKVAVRNLFRYKKRFWMTVIGIGGCTALLITGFGLRDSIRNIFDIQYDELTTYHAQVSLADNLTDDELTEITRALDNNALVTDWTLSSSSSITAESESRSVDSYVNLFAVTDESKFGSFVHLRSRTTGEEVPLTDDGAVITEKLSELLDVGVGDTITLVDADNSRTEVTITGLAENYVMHYIYLSHDAYVALYGEEPPVNSILLHYTEDTQAVSDAVSSELIALSGVSSVSRTEELRESIARGLDGVDYAVVVVVVAAAALAFVVLYNLTNINITERLRELATLKVLGFYDRELSAYIYRENVFLTVFGVLLGLVLGKFLHQWLVRTVEIDMAMFGRDVEPMSYVFAVLLTILFSFLVNLAAHRRLKKIDMVESLKTVE
ncbi:MAG TPA: ABC transporter permease [Candidatus Galloscillospira excrementavium]|nr:ABC transporter permease [Candidatus Galloscillospira excrementavium]